MPLYSYEAFTKEGKKVKGSIDAPSLSAVREQLHRQGLYPIAIQEATQESRLGFFQRFFMRGVSLKDKIMFTKQCAVLIKAGVPLLQALDLLIDQFEGRMHAVLISVKDEVKEGISLADAMEKYPRIFDTIYVQLVRAGEATGKLDEILIRLSEYLERQEEVRRKIRSAMQYPIIQFVVICVVVGVLLTAVVPQLQAVFEAFGKELPVTTRIVLAVSDFIRDHVLAILFGITTLVALIIYVKKTAWGRRTLDIVVLKLPLVRYVAQTSAIVQFCYTLGILIESGVNLAESLDIVVKIINNRILAETLYEARDKIVKQGQIAQYLKQTGIFPPMAIYLIRTGEETGNLGSMLLLVARNNEVELSSRIDALIGVLNPAMLVFMAIVVGFVIFAIATPLSTGAETFTLE